MEVDEVDYEARVTALTLAIEAGKVAGVAAHPDQIIDRAKAYLDFLTPKNEEAKQE